MGIKSLNKFLKKFTVYETFHISKLEYKKIAIDTPLFLYKFKSVHQDNNWIGCFINLISFLRNWNIHPIFVFEGQSPPEKYATLAGRRDQREKMVQKTNMLQESYTTYETTGEMPPLLQELLSKSTLKSIPNIIDARRKYEIIITSDDICLLKKAFDIMHIDYIQSKGEAEAECANLFYSNQIDFIVSEDTDVLAYNTGKDTKIITNFSAKEEAFTEISKFKVLKALDMDEIQFKDFCIMCGTDYNKNIHGIGPEKAYKILQVYLDIEKIPKEIFSKEKIGILNHKKSRQLFTPSYTDVKTKWCVIPHQTFIIELNIFMMYNRIFNINSKYIYRTLSEAELYISEH